ncbi:MAG TPA: neutral zinc metallopeptidase [Hyphomicrobiaceae bacterium]|nr:neutral zinc metallopeptidase [Hyphomicrobiaceae bacterium]
MRYDQNDQGSSNVEDRRGQRGGGMPGGIQIPIGGGGMGLMPMLIIGALMLLFGINPLDILTGGRGGGGQVEMPQMPRMEPQSRQAGGPNIPGLPGGTQRSPVPAGKDDMGLFVSRVLKDTEDVWERVFQSFGRRYVKPQLVLFTGATRTACGVGQAAMGPFYCPADQKIYIDLAFYDELKRRFNAPGDFAQAYVIAHEVGHHVQTLLGISDRVQQMKARAGQRQSNAIQVRMELQADCLAGVWAALNHQMKNRIEQGDIEEGLNAAAQIGDDMMQKRSQGYVVPDAFTHGSAEQRQRWFKRGLSTGQIQQCDAFSVQDP